MTDNTYDQGRLNLPFVGICTFGKYPYLENWDNINADVDTSGTAQCTGLTTTTGEFFHIYYNETSATESVNVFNFGNPPFAISSGNADANGYGNFEYAVPSGYYALCTKNLAEYG